MAWLYQRDGSENWWLGYRLNGRQYLRSTKTNDRKKAEQELAKLNAIDQAHKAGSLTDEFVALLTRKQSSGESLRGYIQQWLAECKDLSGATLIKYRSVPEEFCKYLNATEAAPLLRDIQTDTVGAFLREKRAKTSTATANHVRRILSAFFNYAVDNRALPVSPVPSSRSLKLTRESKAVRRAFTLAELKTLFDKCPSDFWRYMVMAGFYCGQRMGDLICLPWGAVDFDQKQIRLTQSKTGKNIAVPLRAELGVFLAGLKAKAGNVKAAAPIWPAEAERYEKFGAGSFSNEFYDDVLLPAGLVTPRKQSHHKKKVASETGRRKVNSVSFHCLRHTFVSLLKVSGASQATAKELAGHSSDEISDLYTHIPEAELNRAINQLPEIQPATPLAAREICSGLNS
jgi:integrase